MGIDPAWVEDGDDYVITIFTVGSSATSRGVFQLETQVALREEAWIDPATGKTYSGTRSKAKRTVLLAKHYNISVEHVGMDATGAIAYADMLDEEFGVTGQGILRVNFAENAGDKLPVSLMDERVGKELYFNKGGGIMEAVTRFCRTRSVKGVLRSSVAKGTHDAKVCHQGEGTRGD